MSEIIFPTEGGTRFKYKDPNGNLLWDILLFMDTNSVIGDRFVMGYDDSGNNIVVGTLDGPMDPDSWQALIDSKGGMGAYIVSKLPQIRAMLAAHFDYKPHFPPETNATPYTAVDFNNILDMYVAIQPVAGQTHPTVNIVPYVPPA